MYIVKMKCLFYLNPWEQLLVSVSLVNFQTCSVYCLSVCLSVIFLSLISFSLSSSTLFSLVGVSYANFQAPNCISGELFNIIP